MIFPNFAFQILIFSFFFKLRFFSKTFKFQYFSSFTETHSLEETEKLSAKKSEYERTKLLKEEERIKLERNQQNENKLTHDLLAERDRTHELQIDLAECEMKLKHSVAERKREQERGFELKKR